MLDNITKPIFSLNLLLTPTSTRTNVFYGHVFREYSDEFCDPQKVHECTFMPFLVVEWIQVYVFGNYQVMTDGFFAFERLEYQMCLSNSKETPPPPPARTNVIYGQVFRENSDKFWFAQKLHEGTFKSFSVVEWIKVDVFGSYQVMADGFYTFERLEYQICLSNSKETPPPLMQLVISN